MLYLIIIVAILAIVVIYWISTPNACTGVDEGVVWGIPNWQPTVCDPFYQNCCANTGWTYSDGYFYPTIC